MIQPRKLTRTEETLYWSFVSAIAGGILLMGFGLHHAATVPLEPEGDVSAEECAEGEECVEVGEEGDGEEAEEE